MLRIALLFVALILLSLIASRVSAQAFQPGYVVLTTAPEPGMIPVGTAVNLSVLNAQTGTMQLKVGTITGYVAWFQPIRTPEYYVTFDSSTWFILNRETLSQGNPALASSRFAYGGVS